MRSTTHEWFFIAPMTRGSVFFAIIIGFSLAGRGRASRTPDPSIARSEIFPLPARQRAAARANNGDRKITTPADFNFKKNNSNTRSALYVWRTLCRHPVTYNNFAAGRSINIPDVALLPAPLYRPFSI